MKKAFFIAVIVICLITLYGFHVFKEEKENKPIITPITVSISGAIKIPGTYQVKEEATLKDLIFYAGGLLNNSNIENLDLKTKLTDLNLYYIPFIKINDEEIKQENLININTATKEELMTLPGIGEVKALAIINYRTIHGPFKELRDLLKVTGIGEKTYEQLLEKITI